MYKNSPGIKKLIKKN